MLDGVFILNCPQACGWCLNSPMPEANIEHFTNTIFNGFITHPPYIFSYIPFRPGPEISFSMIQHLLMLPSNIKPMPEPVMAKIHDVK